MNPGSARTRRSDSFSAEELARIVKLLRDTETSIAAIAIRFGRPAAAVRDVNRKLGIRKYITPLVWTVGDVKHDICISRRDYLVP